MSVAKKKPYQYPNHQATDPQARLRADKATAEQLRDKLQSRILENPKAAKKAALLLALWIDGKAPLRKLKK